MREIKFRAWDVTNEPNKMIGWEDLCKYHSEMVWLFNPNNPQIKVMQFTGLHDNREIPIYEGDILEGIDGLRFTISFREGVFGYEYFNQFQPLKNLGNSFEVIGNIYETPGLITT